MSSAEEFNLRWNNHLNTISQLLGEFLNNKSLCDVTLSAEGQTISCHRVILAACSTYFQGIFNQVNDKALVVMVKDAKFIDLKSLVDFMYYGEVSVEHDRLNSLLRTAESLKVKGLADEKKKEERILSEPPMPVNVPQPAAVPQKRVMPPMDSMAKRQRVSAPAFAHSPRPSSASIPSPRVEGGVSQDGVQPKQELVDLEGDENDTGDQQSYLEGDEDSNLSGAGPSSSGMEGFDDSGQMEGVEGQDDVGLGVLVLKYKEIREKKGKEKRKKTVKQASVSQTSVLSERLCGILYELRSIGDRVYRRRLSPILSKPKADAAFYVALDSRVWSTPEYDGYIFVEAVHPSKMDPP
ncbi:unnamed protein product [Cyprideis torosa]|uniref:Uncharacterized protein n=1 Tax=Cyprideis torosa TaxID=163714 RepID=A0A7R8WHH5_9CRUS|nr:unnamed protein product [Cyprideis torosa]CAG0892930.1 unnamed protein product [Cyprideis torosa]